MPTTQPRPRSSTPRPKRTRGSSTQPAPAEPEGQQWFERARGGLDPGYRGTQSARDAAPATSPPGGHASRYPERGPQTRHRAERDWEAGSLVVEITAVRPELPDAEQVALLPA